MEIFDENREMSKDLFVFLKYNRISKSSTLSNSDEALFQECKKKFKLFFDSLKSEDGQASTLLGSITSMFGFTRHYCSISGMPIVGKYFKIGSKIVSQEAYESYQIIQKMEKMPETELAKKSTKRLKKE